VIEQAMTPTGCLAWPARRSRCSCACSTRNCGGDDLAKKLAAAAEAAGADVLIDDRAERRA